MIAWLIPLIMEEHRRRMREEFGEDWDDIDICDISKGWLIGYLVLLLVWLGFIIYMFGHWTLKWW